MPVESRKAQLEAMQSSKQSDSERDFERDSAGNAKALSNPTTLARAAAPSANAGAAFAGVAEHVKACTKMIASKYLKKECISDRRNQTLGRCKNTCSHQCISWVDSENSGNL